MLGAKAYTGKRFAAGSFVDGDWVPGAESALSIFGTVRPMKPRDVVLLKEGEELSDHRKLYTATELRPADRSTKTPADRVVIGGEDFEVVGIHDNTNGGLSHYKVILRRLMEGEP